MRILESPGIPVSMRITVSAIHWWGAGFDVICHATNHAMDKGRKGLINCAKILKERTIRRLQCWEFMILEILLHLLRRREPVILDLPDMKIAVLNCTYGTNGIPLPDDMPYAVDLLIEEQVAGISGEQRN